MKSSAIFVLLEYLVGFGFGMAGIFIFSEHDNSSLMTSVFYGFIVAFISMFMGISLVGYFHLRTIKALNKFAKAMVLSLGGLFLFLGLYLLFANLLHDLGILAILVPLTGGVIGFNWALGEAQAA